MKIYVTQHALTHPIRKDQNHDTFHDMPCATWEEDELQTSEDGSMRWLALIHLPNAENTVVEQWKKDVAAHLRGDDLPRCECELFVEKYFGLPCNMAEDAIIPGADFGHLVNLLAMFRDEQLAAANKRIAELEAWKESEMNVWGPVIEFAQDNVEALGIKLGSSISAYVLRLLSITLSKKKGESPF